MKKNPYAIIEASGRQFRVEPDQVIEIEGLTAKASTKGVVLDKVLAVQKGDSLEIGNPFIKGAKVSCEFVEEFKGPKKIIFKMRRRKNYRRKNGYRSVGAKLRVKEIIL